MTDCDFLLAVLADGRDHTLNEILQRSFRERGCGLTVHSRAADLRRLGHVVEHRNVAGAARGAASVYRLVGSLRAAAASGPPASVPAAAAVERIAAAAQSEPVQLALIPEPPARREPAWG